MDIIGRNCQSAAAHDAFLLTASNERVHFFFPIGEINQYVMKKKNGYDF